jgi:hypothetical protein
MSPMQIAREVGRLEASLASPASPTVPPPQVKVVSSAPAPPPTLGSKPSIPGDEIEEALATGDFRKYRDAMNRQEMASHR